MKDPIDEPRREPRGKHKDTKRFCKGKPGREHVTEMRRDGYAAAERVCHLVEWQVVGRPDDPHTFWWCNHIIACTVCGKHLQEVTSNNCPDRV